MKTIPLTQGKVAIVDDQDFKWLSQFKWHAQKYERKNHTLWYAGRNIRINRGPRRQRRVMMHKEIGIRIGIKGNVDHRDGDGLNNQRQNIRPATKSQNAANRKKAKITLSKFKGVYPVSESSTWLAKIGHGGISHYLGCFPDQVQAAMAYDAAAIKFFGAFASLNFPSLCAQCS